jgi:hypothetical protein
MTIRITEITKGSSKNGFGTGQSNYKHKYEGEVKDGQPHGKGTLSHHNRKTIYYEGDWVFGEMTGKGKLYWNSGRPNYEGYFVDGKFHGKGKEFGLDDNEQDYISYEGDWVNGEYHGHGTQYNMNGSKFYEGEYKNGYRHGKGILYESNGETCVGEFKKGEFISPNENTMKHKNNIVSMEEVKKRKGLIL